MDRRQLIRWFGSAAGLSILDGLRPSEMLGLGRDVNAQSLAGASRTAASVLTMDQRATLGIAAERIIPADDTPGATDARVAGFIEHILADWFDAAERDRFLGGLADLDERARANR